MFGATPASMTTPAGGALATTRRPLPAAAAMPGAD